MFHDGSNYDYDFIIRELAEEFWRAVWVLGGKHEEVLKILCTNQKRKWKRQGNTIQNKVHQ